MRVEFLIDGELVATDTAAPYGATLVTPSDLSQATLVAAAVDSGANRTESAPVIVNVIEDDTPPGVVLDEPLEGSSILEGKTLSLRATASDNIALDRVEFRANAELIGVHAIGSTTTGPLSVSRNFPVPADFADAGPTALAIEGLP